MLSSLKSAYERYAHNRRPAKKGHNLAAAHLWPYALRAAKDSRKNTPTAKSNECPMSRFCRMARVPKLRHQYHFGCPVY
ncbi:MAG: hypothetical protein ACK53Y_00715, partial [bacterium]